jgi:hypothetical protein
VWIKQNLPGGSSAVVPPDPMPNSEVKRRSADGSVGSPHARVGNCQASNKAKNLSRKTGVFCFIGIHYSKYPLLRQEWIIYIRILIITKSFYFVATNKFCNIVAELFLNIPRFITNLSSHEPMFGCLFRVLSKLLLKLMSDLGI